MANHVTNERGETVVAVGAEGSLERLLCEFPDTWFERASEDQRRLYLQSRNPTHRTPLVDGTDGMNGAFIGWLNLWKVGERIVAGKREFHYAHWSMPHSYMSWVDRTYFREEQEPFTPTNKRPEAL